MCLCVLGDGANDHAEQGQHHCAPEGRGKSIYAEAADDAGCQQDHQSVNDQQKQAEGEDAEGDGDDLQEEANCRVEQADDHAAASAGPRPSTSKPRTRLETTSRAMALKSH